LKETGKFWDGFGYDCSFADVFLVGETQVAFTGTFKGTVEIPD
jgi:hypothetical protein